MKRKINRISYSYTCGIDNTDEYAIPIKLTRFDVSSNVKRYFNFTHKLAVLSKCSILLLEYLSETMDDNNMVSLNCYHREEFINHIQSICSLTYTDYTVKTAIKQLKQEGLIIIISRGTHMINPRFYFSGSEQERKTVLRKLYSDVSLGSFDKDNIKAALGIDV